MLAMPGLIDCHTHIVFAGSRELEFEKRCHGETYEQIAKAGGGILNTVRQTRAASFESLVLSATERLDSLLSFGVTTVEVKSGYGLDMVTEMKMLEVIAHLNGNHLLDVVPTFLGAHSVPPEHKGKRENYIDLLCEEMIPEVGRRQLAEFCDVFCEEGVFNVAESRKILSKAIDFGLKVKIHAEQLHRTGGARLGADLKAVSADHLDHIIEDDARAISRAGTVAVLLPGATLFLGMKNYAPARMLLEEGAAVALSTDCNPGSSMTENLQLMMTLGCTQMGMTPVEALRAVTVHAAKAIDRGHDRGRLSVGFLADVALFDVPNYVCIPYRMGHNRLWGVIKRGKVASGFAPASMDKAHL
jgi:imidazolonepropionase